MSEPDWDCSARAIFFCAPKKIPLSGIDFGAIGPFGKGSALKRANHSSPCSLSYHKVGEGKGLQRPIEPKGGRSKGHGVPMKELLRSAVLLVFVIPHRPQGGGE